MCIWIEVLIDTMKNNYAPSRALQLIDWEMHCKLFICSLLLLTKLFSHIVSCVEIRGWHSEKVSQKQETEKGLMDFLNLLKSAKVPLLKHIPTSLSSRSCSTFPPLTPTFPPSPFFFRRDDGQNETVWSATRPTAKRTPPQVALRMLMVTTVMMALK